MLVGIWAYGYECGHMTTNVGIDMMRLRADARAPARARYAGYFAGVGGRLSSRLTRKHLYLSPSPLPRRPRPPKPHQGQVHVLVSWKGDQAHLCASTIADIYIF